MENKELLKRKRNVNFNKRKEEFLVELVKKYQQVIENKKTDAVMWKDKEACWVKLAAEFNSLGLLVPRTVAQLQLKLEGQMIGGGRNQAKPLDDVEQKLKNIIQLSVDGLPADFDCDVIDADVGNDIIDAEIVEKNEVDVDDTYYVTVLPDEYEHNQNLIDIIPEQNDPEPVPEPCKSRKLQWDVVTPQQYSKYSSQK